MTRVRTADAPPAAGVLPMLWVQGRRVDARAPAHVSALDRGFLLGDGLFETMRAYHGAVFRLDRHLDRLARGACVLGITMPPGIREVVESAMHELRAAGALDASVRLTLTRGVGAPGLAPDPRGTPTVTLALHPIPERPSPARPLTARIARARRNEHAATAGIKTLSYAEAVVALAEARAAGADDALLLDTAGHVAEGSASNVFAYVHDTLVTPPLSCGVLPGITREAVLELAAALGVATAERALAPGELAAAGEMFLTSSLRELAPVDRVDDHAIGRRGDAGPVTRALIDAFTALVARECAA